MKLVVDLNRLEGFDEWVEKARKGEQVGGSYMYRENIPEKVTTKNGKTVTRRYKYYYVADMLKDTADKILKNIGSFFFKGNQEEVKRIEKSYETENIQKDYGADKKTWYQHVMEYFSHRALWDKRFSDKTVAEKWKKPVKTAIAEKVDVKGMETPAESVPEIKTSAEARKPEKKWKANPSLMRKVWSLYTGKQTERQEKQTETAAKVIEENKKKAENSDGYFTPKKVDWFQAFAGSWNSFYPNGTGGKPYSSVTRINEKGRRETIQRTANSKTDLSGVLDNVNDFVFDTERLGERARQNFIKRLAEMGFYAQKEYTDEKGVTKYMLMIRNGSKAGNVEMIPNPDYKKKEYTVITRDDSGTEIESKVFNNIDSTQAYMDKQRRALESKESGNIANGGKVKDGFESLSRCKSLYNEAYRQAMQDLRDGKVLQIDDDTSLTIDDLAEDKQAADLSLRFYTTHFTDWNSLDTVNANLEMYAEEPDDRTDENVIRMAKEKAIQDSLRAYLGFNVNLPEESEESDAEKHKNRSNAMLGNQNAKKDGVSDESGIVEETVDNQLKQAYNENSGGKNGENNTRAEQTGLSERAGDLRSGGGEEAGGQNVAGAARGNNGIESVLGLDTSGNGLGNADSSVNIGRGRITKGQAREIRRQCREILQKPDSAITADDKAVLAQYVGAGGTGEENSSNSGVLYEFYTPRNVISKVWQLVDKYNPDQGKTVIEPSSGIGRFAEGRKEKFTMFELEDESARIAHILHPDADVVQGAFQENFMKNKGGRFTKNFKPYDVAVGNPPYGAYTGKYKGLGEGKDYKRYETYFMSRTLDTLKDGGVIAMVVPSGFMDGKSTYGKDIEKIAEKGELLEAWRLPNGTFDSTDVGTDIVVFRKGKGGSVEQIKSYFEKNPDHIAGDRKSVV